MLLTTHSLVLTTHYLLFAWCYLAVCCSGNRTGNIRQYNVRLCFAVPGRFLLHSLWWICSWAVVYPFRLAANWIICTCAVFGSNAWERQPFAAAIMAYTPALAPMSRKRAGTPDPNGPVRHADSVTLRIETHSCSQTTEEGSTCEGNPLSAGWHLTFELI